MGIRSRDYLKLFRDNLSWIRDGCKGERCRGLILDSSTECKIFACWVRDKHNGLGFRDTGRILMYEADVSPDIIMKIGRADDIFEIGYMHILKEVGNRYWYFLYKHLFFKPEGRTNYLVRKWMPRERKGNKHLVKIKKIQRGIWIV